MDSTAGYAQVNRGFLTLHDRDHMVIYPLNELSNIISEENLWLMKSLSPTHEYLSEVVVPDDYRPGEFELPPYLNCEQLISHFITIILYLLAVIYRWRRVSTSRERGSWADYFNKQLRRLLEAEHILFQIEYNIVRGYTDPRLPVFKPSTRTITRNLVVRENSGYAHKLLPHVEIYSAFLGRQYQPTVWQHVYRPIDIVAIIALVVYFSALCGIITEHGYLITQEI